MNKYLKLGISVGICLLAGFIGSVATTPSITTWYVTLKKPFFTPPNWLFAPAWTTLFILMGVALWLVWLKGWKKKEVQPALFIFGTQLALNILWSLVFFGLHLPSVAVLVILTLWIAILLTIIRFLKVSQLAGFLLIPYLMWVSFATLLNAGVALLNPF